MLPTNRVFDSICTQDLSSLLKQLVIVPFGYIYYNFVPVGEVFYHL